MDHLLTVGRFHAESCREKMGLDDYDAHAVSAVEQELKLIAAKYPETREVVDRTISLLSTQWARLVMARQALK